MIRRNHRARGLGAATLLAFVVVGAQGCKQDAAVAKTTVDNTISLPPAQIAIVTSQEIRTGPSLSGSLEAETQATVRAEIGGPVLQTYAEAGQPVQSGQQLVRIDESSLRDAMLSAQSAVTTAQNMVDVDQHEVQRDDALLKAGAIPDRQLEQAHSALISAQAQVADARSRLSSAEKQLDKAIVKSPFTGIVSVRSVSGGDVVSPGTALYTIINPATMRLEASVPSDALGAIRLNAPVEFTVNGYPTRKFTGHVIARDQSDVVDPSTAPGADLSVSLPNEGGHARRLVCSPTDGSPARSRTTLLWSQPRPPLSESGACVRG